MKIKIIVFIVCVVFWVLLFVLLFSGCSFLQGNAQNANYKLLYVNSQIQLANTQSLLNKSAAELKEMRESEKILRNSLDSLYKYTDEKTDSLYSVIAIKDILIRSNDANIDTMLWSINWGVINYINKLRAKYDLDSL